MMIPPSGSGKMSKLATFLMGLSYGFKGKPGVVKSHKMEEFKGEVPANSKVYYANKKLDAISEKPLVYNTHIIVVQDQGDQLLVDIYKEEEWYGIF